MYSRAATLESLLEWDRRWARRLNASVGIASVRVPFRLVSRLGDGVFWYALMLASIVRGGPGWTLRCACLPRA